MYHDISHSSDQVSIKADLPLHLEFTRSIDDLPNPYSLLSSSEL